MEHLQQLVEDLQDEVKELQEANTVLRNESTSPTPTTSLLVLDS